MQLTTLPATCHTPALPLVAYAFFAGLVRSSKELLDSVGADDDSVPEEDLGGDSAPLQLAAIQVGNLAAELAAAEGVVAHEKVAASDAARRDEATIRLAAAMASSPPKLNPSSSWLGDDVEGAVPINTSIRHFSPTSIRDWLHVMETFAGITCGVL